MNEMRTKNETRRGGVWSGAGKTKDHGGGHGTPPMVMLSKPLTIHPLGAATAGRRGEAQLAEAQRVKAEAIQAEGTEDEVTVPDWIGDVSLQW